MRWARLPAPPPARLAQYAASWVCPCQLQTAMEGHLSPATTILREISPANALSKHVLIVVAQQ